MSSFSMKRKARSKEQGAGRMERVTSLFFWFLASCCLLLPGCASLTNPVANAIPVSRLPPEILGESRELEQTIPEKFLVAPRQDPYLITKGDVLGIYIKTVTGDEKLPPPVVTSPDSELPPSIGYP